MIKRFRTYFSTLLLRSSRREGKIIEIQEAPIPDPFYRAFGDYTDEDLWEMGWHDAQWNSKPNPRFEANVPYLRGWADARGEAVTK